MENAPTNVQGIITQQVNRAKTQKAKTPAQLMQSIVNAEGSKALLENSLKENSGAFAASVIDLYASDTYLQNCAPQAVFAEVLKAVSLKLPINKQLGFAYIIPGGTTACGSRCSSWGTRGTSSSACGPGHIASSTPTR